MLLGAITLDLTLLVARFMVQNFAQILGKSTLLSLPIGSAADEESYFQSWEEEAILLGLHLRKYLGVDSLVINDCKYAVRNLTGKYSNIFWLPRKYVKKAHYLKISEATKIYTQDLWDAEWEEEGWDF